MRFSIILLCILCSCKNHPKAGLQLPHPKQETLDSIRTQTNAALILLHHQVQKLSVVSKTVFSREAVDSLFNYVGQINPDTTCLQGGLFNYLGQIDLYIDSSRNKKLGELHFVLEGNCADFYLQTGNYLRRYRMMPEGKAALAKLYNANKSVLR